MKLYKGKPIKYVIEEFARENNLKVVMHFPHSSLGVPDSFWKDVVIDQTSFTKINFLMSDLLLLELFEFWNYEKVIAPIRGSMSMLKSIGMMLRRPCPNMEWGQYTRKTFMVNRYIRNH